MSVSLSRHGQLVCVWYMLQPHRQYRTTPFAGARKDTGRAPLGLNRNGYGSRRLRMSCENHQVFSPCGNISYHRPHTFPVEPALPARSLTCYGQTRDTCLDNLQTKRHSSPGTGDEALRTQVRRPNRPHCGCMLECSGIHVDGAETSFSWRPSYRGLG